MASGMAAGKAAGKRQRAGNATAAQRAVDYLLQLTDLPTAAGHEERVAGWLERWARRRRGVAVRRDRFGNMMISRAGARSRRPIVIEAHMDHPAFVVRQVMGEREVEAEFRGGVHERFFSDARVALVHGGQAVQKGVVTEVMAARADRPGVGPVVRMRFDKPVTAAAGDIVRWDLPGSVVRGGLMRAPACDDLAGVAAGVSAFEQLARGRRGDVRLLFTRAEEVGLIGAIAACRGRFLPRGSRVVALEMSRSYAESPIGGGPILRVGDRMSTFDPDLTYRLGEVAARLAGERGGFKWQRKLMPGGTCEASAFSSLGYSCGCLCLALGNYHNMDEHSGKVGSEYISVDDYLGLVRWLVAIGRGLDDQGQTPGLADRLGRLYEQRKWVLEGGA